MFGRTLREDPSEAELVSHKLSVRAGLVQPLAAGIYSYLPLGWRVMQRLIAIVRGEMDAIGGQELLMPIVQPAELWRATGRYDAPAPGPALVRFRDRSSHDLVLAMTHEEAVTDLARQVIRSYRQLPALVYQVQTKFRDEPRARGGLVRVREFTMKDAYSFHADAASLDDTYEQVRAAYGRIMARAGLEVVQVEADPGMMGGARSHEFMCLSDQGEDTLILCPACGYAANVETALAAKEAAATGATAQDPPQTLERVHTPGATTIEAVARYVGVSTRQTLKAVFYTSGGQVIFAVVRGDLEVNEAKLSALLGGIDLAPASAEELAAAGLVAGYASPIGVTGVRVVADDSILTGNNWVVGANEPGYHYLNANYPRDFRADLVADIALARAGDACPRCGQPLRAKRGIEVGHIFQLGAKYAEALGATYLDQSGVAKPLLMGCYGIGIGRLLACVIEQHHDEAGILWPPEVAPFDLEIVSLAGKDAAVEQAAEALYTRLQGLGQRVLYDDRPERAGVKFNDADLIGIPVRLTVSQRTLEQGGVELKRRAQAERLLVPLDELEQALALGG
jgi:prolyl-tRNA synthetase